MSSQGYLKVSSIMRLDDILNVLIQNAYDNGKMTKELLTNLQNLNWSHENYYVSIWGEPNSKAAWGLNFGVHHVAITITVTVTWISVSPFFLGPAPSVYSN